MQENKVNLPLLGVNISQIVGKLTDEDGIITLSLSLRGLNEHETFTTAQTKHVIRNLSFDNLM